MAKSKRLIEIMMAVNKKKSFNAKQLASEFGVSTRTIMRDMQELSALGVPFYSEVGPNGGYKMLNERMLPPVAFTEGEALAVFFASHALRHYANLPFEAETDSVLRKFYSYMSEDIRDRIDRMRERFDLVTPMRHTSTPYLSLLLDAAIDQKVVRIEYESKQDKRLRDVQPIGIYASNGFWYCPAYCFHRRDFRLFRCDRVRSVELIERKAVDLTQVHTGNWDSYIEEESPAMELYVELTATGVQRCESELWPAHKMQIHVREDGTGWLGHRIPTSSLPFFGHFFIGLGTDAKVKAPDELIHVMREMLDKLMAQYQ
ncbi:putative transcriptional regulator [Brevibacillus brevis NBRC 100599]|uniref:Putative transcriptional regulator n=1 Tax=Brevibacillus brevis (strain 47 / JCM 6285 / NBRC 100599) TaxID=358681 RepID=C0ZDF9_BREBN|nr:YafY family protein [Brevibacillus brevis]BAH43818.1 putative transcriptional regulator [Brevibacillus brevis NBRC 100599]